MSHPESSLKKSFAIILCLLVAGAAFWYVYDVRQKEAVHKPKPETNDAVTPLPTQMEDGPALEDLPTLSNIPAPASKAELIKIESLHAGDVVRSPLTVTGQARGNWFFEASFPIKVLDKNGTIIGQGHAEAQGEWMTENFVPWKATVSFVAPASGGGEVVFMKDNPSGLSEYDAGVRVPVVFAHPQ